MHPMEEMLRTIIWRRRTAFYTHAVEAGIIDQATMDKLMLLHLVRDQEQDERDGRAP